MMHRSMLIATGLVTLWAGAATLAAPAQDRPGLVMPARVYVENRTRSEALPVSVQEVVSGALKLQIDGPVTISSSSIVQARLLQQVWEYRTLVVGTGQDLGEAMTGPGSQGWETTGIQYAASGGTTLLLKRPAQR